MAKTKHEPRMLHIGVDVTNLNTVMRLSAGAGYPFTIDGDGWEVWGESVGSDNNDTFTLHLTSVRAVSDKHAAQIVATLAHLLTPMRQNTDGGPLAVLSDVNVWSEDVATLHAESKITIREKANR